MRFRDQVWPGDTVTATGEITALDDGGASMTADADLVVSNQDDEAVLTGNVTVTVTSCPLSRLLRQKKLGLLATLGSDVELDTRVVDRTYTRHLIEPRGRTIWARGATAPLGDV